MKIIFYLKMNVSSLYFIFFICSLSCLYSINPELESVTEEILISKDESLSSMKNELSIRNLKVIVYPSNVQSLMNKLKQMRLLSSLLLNFENDLTGSYENSIMSICGLYFKQISYLTIERPNYYSFNKMQKRVAYIAKRLVNIKQIRFIHIEIIAEDTEDEEIQSFISVIKQKRVKLLLDNINVITYNDDNARKEMIVDILNTLFYEEYFESGTFPIS